MNLKVIQFSKLKHQVKVRDKWAKFCLLEILCLVNFSLRVASIENINTLNIKSLLLGSITELFNFISLFYQFTHLFCLAMHVDSLRC